MGQKTICLKDSPSRFFNSRRRKYFLQRRIYISRRRIPCINLPSIGWFLQILKISRNNQEWVLWIKLLSHSDFLKDVLTTWLLFCATPILFRFQPLFLLHPVAGFNSQHTTHDSRHRVLRRRVGHSWAACNTHTHIIKRLYCITLSLSSILVFTFFKFRK